MKQTGTNKSVPVTTLFLDIGGVLLSNGWGHESRQLAAEKFNLNFSELEERHHLTFVTYEEGKLTLKEYLNRVVFYQKRTFTRDDFQKFMFDQSTPYTEMIELIRKVKEQNRLKIAVVNNEAYELNEYRIKKFKLNQFVDFYISSCFVHFRKPDADIFRIALDIAQVRAKHVVYIENTEMFVDIARESGIRSILHTDYKSTRLELSLLGLKL
jgi:putative hydrolase of the HAD superfamily